jgi:hypothetical protein
MDDTDVPDGASSVASRETRETESRAEDVVSEEQAVEQKQDSQSWDVNLNRAGRVFGRLVNCFVFTVRYD